MLPAGSRVLCAVSGGADSVCLLHLLSETPDLELVCAHFNHALRGAEADRDEAFVRTLCQALKVPFVCGREDVAAYAAANGLGTEAAARTLRYAFLERTAAEYGCTCIATAHNADDNAETVLLHLLRGSGTRGLSGIPPVRDRIVRPLLPLTRQEIEAYLNAHGLSHVEDSTNGSDEYARNRIRHRVLPLLREENPAAVEHICAAASLLRQDEAYFSLLAAQFIEKEYRNGALSVSALLSLPRPVGARVLLRLCPEAKQGHVAALFALCERPAVHGAVDVPGLRVVLDRDRLCFGPAEPQPVFPQPLLPGEQLISAAGWRVNCSFGTFGKEIHNSFNTFYFKSESICGKLYISTRIAGDSIRLQGRGCTKSLKKLFAEAKLSLHRRDRIPVLRDEIGPVAVVGFGMAERCVPGPGDAVLRVEVKEQTEEVDHGAHDA